MTAMTRSAGDESAPGRPTSVPSGARALAPDLARGFMLLLIAVANATGVVFGGEMSGEPHPHGLERVANLFLFVAVHARAYPMFAMLFGYGIVQLARSRTDRGLPEDGQPGQDGPAVAEPVSQPGPQHQQAAEEHRVPGGHQRAVGRGGVQAGQHGGQGGDDHRHPEHVDELDQAQGGDGQRRGAPRAVQGHARW